MNINTISNIISNENKLIENIMEMEEYYLIKDNNVFKIIIEKLNNEIIIKCKNYEIKLNNNNISLLTKKLMSTIEEAYDFIIKIFEENKVILKDIIINKEIKLILKSFINDIEIILIYNNKKNNFFVNKINQICYEVKLWVNNLNEEIKSLKKEIEKFKINNNSFLNNN